MASNQYESSNADEGMMPMGTFFHTKIFKELVWQNSGSRPKVKITTAKVGCVFPMVIRPDFRYFQTYRWTSGIPSRDQKSIYAKISDLWEA